jgi:hypothetical protein
VTGLNQDREQGREKARLRVQEFLRIVRDEPAQPLEIRVVNAGEVGTGVRVLPVKRDDGGKMTGAVVATP